MGLNLDLTRLAVLRPVADVPGLRKPPLGHSVNLRGLCKPSLGHSVNLKGLRKPPSGHSVNLRELRTPIGIMRIAQEGCEKSSPVTPYPQAGEKKGQSDA